MLLTSVTARKPLDFRKLRRFQSGTRRLRTVFVSHVVFRMINLPPNPNYNQKAKLWPNQSERRLRSSSSSVVVEARQCHASIVTSWATWSNVEVDPVKKRAS
ncbi:hypothetical protein ACFE04_014365 [Oxalis oulophora]